MGASDGPRAGSGGDDAALLRAAKKTLKRREGGCMNLKSLAKSVAADGEATSVCRDAVRRLIEGSDRFTVEGKVVSLSKGRGGEGGGGEGGGGEGGGGEVGGSGSNADIC